MLTDLLGSSRALGGIRIEYFNPYVEQEIFQQEGPFSDWPEYFRHVLTTGTTSNGVFGAKIHADNLVYLMYQLRVAFPDLSELDDLTLLRRVFPEVDPARSFIYIWRQQALAQAVSFAIAETTGSWNDTTPTKREPVYDRSTVFRAYWTLMQQHSAWQDWFARHGIVPLPVKYERLISDHQETIREVFEHTGVSCPQDADLFTVRRRQSTELNTLWVARLESEMRQEFPFPIPLDMPEPGYR